jgi:hypothetical protein
MILILSPSMEARSRSSFLRRSSCARFEVALIECLGVSIRDLPRFFVLVLRVSSTRTRRDRIEYEYEYEYHFIEYEYERSQNSATSKCASWAH